MKASIKVRNDIILEKVLDTFICNPMKTFNLNIVWVKNGDLVEVEFKSILLNNILHPEIINSPKKSFLH